jgi:hypothetical protein
MDKDTVGCMSTLSTLEVFLIKERCVHYVYLLEHLEICDRNDFFTTNFQVLQQIDIVDVKNVFPALP